MEEPMKPAAAIYCRISNEDQSEFSLPSQQAACEEKAEAKGFGTAAEYTFIDNGGLSTEIDRPALTALRECVRSGLVGMVVIYDLDRLARKLSHQLLLLDEFAKRGVQVEFVNAPTEATPEGRMLLTMRGMFSEYEKEKIRERTVRGSRERARQGKVNSAPPFGYTTGADGTLSVDPERAKVVRRIFALMIDGLSSSEVAVRLNADGIPGPKQSGWIRATILDIGKREAYASGELLWNRTTAAEPRRRRKPPKPGKSKLSSSRARAEAEWFRIAVPPIIDRATFDACQQAIERNRKVKSGRPSPVTRFLLSGITRCAACGSAVVGSSSGSGRWLYYGCSARRDHRSCSTRGGVRAAPLEAQVWSAISGALRDPKTTFDLYNRHLASQAKSDHERERTKLAASLEKLRTSEFNCRKSMLDPDLADSYQAFRDDLKMLLAQRRDIERRLDAIQPARALADRAVFKNLFDGLAITLREATDREKQKALLQRHAEIRLGSETLEIDLMLDLGDDPDAGTYRNYQPHQRPAFDRSQNRRRQTKIQPERSPSQSDRPGNRDDRRRPHRP
jgi:site-specific DNA recombinase